MRKTINITWRITPPDPNDLSYAEIRRSEDGIAFSTIVKTEPNLNALTPEVEVTFSFNDDVTVPANSNKTFWYKIVVYDNDGNYTYSNVEQISIETSPPPAPILEPLVIV